jgi:hypothetical protein
MLRNFLNFSYIVFLSSLPLLLCGNEDSLENGLEKHQLVPVSEYSMKDSGKREAYESGAVREARTNKGRYDLISPIALRRLAVVCEKGALKYHERNWEKGMPMSRLMDSAMRHITQYLEGYRDEDHLAHAMWNLMAAIHFEELRPDLNDLPQYEKKKSETSHP